MKTRSIYWAVILLNILAIATAMNIGVRSGNLLSQFGERQSMTIFSALQLLTISGLSYQILKVRSPGANGSFWKSSAVIWGILSLGFLFLACDEIFMIHESTDQMIHSFFNIQETALTDRIDDMVIVLYCLIGAGALIAYRHEFTRHQKMLPFFIMGSAMLALMIILDVITNGEDILSLFFSNETVPRLRLWLAFIEDSFKILAEALFVLTFYTILQEAKN